MSQWSAVLTDLTGNLLAELDNVKDRHFTRAFNGLDVFTFRAGPGHELFHDLHRHALNHSALVKLYEYDAERYTNWPGYRRLWFHGPLITTDKQANGSVVLGAAGPFWRLGYRLIGKSKTGFSKGTSDRGAIARDALAEANLDTQTGIRANRIGGSSGTSVGPWYFKPVADVINEMAVPLDGFDWEVEPIEYDQGDIGLLNIYGAGGQIIGEQAAAPTVAAGAGWEGAADPLTGGNTVYRLGDGASSSRLRFTGFDFSAIPANAVIVGITATFGRYGDNGGPFNDGGGDVVESVVQLVKGGVAVGSNKASGKWPFQSLTRKSFGGPADVWGVAGGLTLADVQAAGFGFEVAAQHGGNGSGAEAWVEGIPRLAVNYTSESVGVAPPWSFARGKFEYGDGTEGTIQNFGHVGDASGLMTRGWSLPPSFPEAVEAPIALENPEAILARGLFEGLVEGDLEVAALRQKLVDANVAIRKQPRQLISLEPHSYAHKLVPRFGTDYIVGDIIHFFAVEDGKVTVDADFRIYTVDVNIDDTGTAIVQPSLVPA